MPFSAKTYILDFAADERGAVTVDYVMLTAAACTCAIGAKTIVGGGLVALTDTVEDELGGERYTPGLTYRDAFDNGAGDWVGADVMKMVGLGYVLGPLGGSNDTVSRTFDMLTDEESPAVMRFDVLAIDSLDYNSGDVGIIKLGGVAIGEVRSQHGDTEFVAYEDLPDGISINGVVVDNDVQLGGESLSDNYFKDSRTSVEITIDNPTAAMEFEFQGVTNQGLNDESWALDNFKVTHLSDPDTEVASNATSGGSGDDDDDDD